MGTPWNTLKEQNDTFVARHTLAVLACCVNDPDFPQFTDNERNILKWASLLHDIAKKSAPIIRGKDHVHPFRSGAIVLDLLVCLGLIPNINKQRIEQIQQVKRLLEESV